MSTSPIWKEEEDQCSSLLLFPVSWANLSDWDRPTEVRFKKPKLLTLLYHGVKLLAICASEKGDIVTNLKEIYYRRLSDQNINLEFINHLTSLQMPGTPCWWALGLGPIGSHQPSGRLLCLTSIQSLASPTMNLPPPLFLSVRVWYLQYHHQYHYHRHIMII